jgi:hypothetical protein
MTGRLAAPFSADRDEAHRKIRFTDQQQGQDVLCDAIVHVSRRAVL